MKNIKRLAVVTALGLAVCGPVMAQEHKGNGTSQDAAQHHGDPATLVKHLSEVFPQVAAFDVNKDGKLDDAEKEALGKAIAEGKLEIPAHAPPDGTKASAEKMLNHVAEMYARVSLYDTNHDGKLDEKEQAALKTAIEKGEFAPHGQHSHEGENHQ
jgi:hypothetical protein